MDPISMAASRAVGSTLGTLAGRFLRQAGGGIANRIAARNAIKAGPSAFHSVALEQIPNLTPASREKITQFIQSGEFEQLTLRLSIATSANKKSEIAALRKSLNESMRLYRTVPQNDLQAVSDALFDDLSAAVTLKLAELNSEKKVSLTSARVVSAQAAASTRNCDLICKIDDLRTYDEFHKHFSRQVALTENKVRPPQIDSGSRIAIDRIYVQATLKEEGDNEERFHRETPLLPKDIFEIYPRVVILGDPGGGKSTLATKLCVDLARGRNRGSAAKAPFKVVMRDYAKYFQNSRVSIVEYIEKICGALYSTPAPEGCIEYLLLNSRAAVIFDGMDELTNTALRQDMVSAVEAFSLAYPGTPIMVTSRKVGYDLSPLDADLFEVLTLGSFSYGQRQSYVRNWFGLMRSGGQPERTRLAENFLNELSHADDLGGNPLMLGLMCALYRGAGYIPRNRPELYRRCSEFLFERWDSSRGILVEKPFERGMQNAMFALALNLMQSSDGASGITEKRLVQFTTSYLHDRYYEDFDSAQDAARQFVEYCRGRAWVLTDVGTDIAGNNLYAFTHRTFLEYFAARQIVRECSDVSSILDVLYSKLRVQEWDVIAQLAIQTLDERLLDGSNGAILALLEKVKEESDRSARIAITSFCARSVEFMDLRPAVLRSVTDNFLQMILAGSIPEDRQKYSLSSAARGLLKAPAELHPVIADQIITSITAMPDKTECLAFALSLTAYTGTADDRGGNYWNEVENQVVDTFEKEVEDLCISGPWFAVKMYQKGRCTLDEVVSRHGVKVIFEDGHHKMAAASSPENLYTFMTYRGQSLEGIEEVSDAESANPEGWRKEVARMLELLLAAPTPWAKTVRMHRWEHDETDSIPEDSDQLFLRILNVMLGGDRLLELVIGTRKRFTSGQRGSIYRAISRARKGEIGETKLRQVLDILPEDRANFVVKWCAREIDILEVHLQ
ncbi:NACHT domain-containing protein [Streptomyces sp. NBC_00057]|uniref:NACHT domain-containing protein n=1 Tax=Streptomyces sp. NBC_00057 TaxID=2975634 RepID=UPI00324E6F49